MRETTNNFNYRGYYGIPDRLLVADDQLLLNHTELDLRTGFQVSSKTQKRYFTLNITQALASPDGIANPDEFSYLCS